ncbi:hypothetical protein Hanom_Chr04g00317261 [Helianthus anomalus]
MLDLEQISVCRENKLPLDPAIVAPAVDAIDYISSENLKPLLDPDVKFKVYMLVLWLFQYLFGYLCVLVVSVIKSWFKTKTLKTRL